VHLPCDCWFRSLSACRQVPLKLPSCRRRGPPNELPEARRRQLTTRPSRYRSDHCHACFSSSNMMKMLQLMWRDRSDGTWDSTARLTVGPCHLVLAAEGKTIIFYPCNLFFYFVSTDERPIMGSQPNLASRSKVVSIYKCPTENFGASSKIWGAKTYFLHFFRNFRIWHRIVYLRNETSHGQTKMLLSIYNVSPTRWRTIRDLWPRNDWDPFAYCDATFGSHYVATIEVTTSLVTMYNNHLWWPLAFLRRGGGQRNVSLPPDFPQFLYTRSITCHRPILRG